MMAQIVMYYLPGCPYCNMAEQILENNGVKDIEKITVDPNPGLRDEMSERTGSRTVPQIFVGRTLVGGLDELSAMDDDGRLDALLKSS